MMTEENVLDTMLVLEIITEFAPATDATGASETMLSTVTAEDCKLDIEVMMRRGARSVEVDLEGAPTAFEK